MGRGSTLRLFHDLMVSRPVAVGQMLVALDFHLGPSREIAVVGELADADADEAGETVLTRDVLQTVAPEIFESSARIEQAALTR